MLNRETSHVEKGTSGWKTFGMLKTHGVRHTMRAAPEAANPGSVGVPLAVDS
jgi:hypothetical protein